MEAQRKDARLRPLAMLAFGAVCISFAAIFVKMLGVGKMGPGSIAFWRMILGSGILFVWAKAAGHSVALPWAIKRWTMLAGFLFFCDLFAWHRSIIYAGAGMATILASTQVFATAILSCLIFKERLSAKYFVAAASAVVGVTLLIGVGSDIAYTGTYVQGVGLGLLTGVFYAHYIVVVKISGQREGTPSSFITLMAWTSLFSAIILGVVSYVTERGEFWPPDGFSWGILFALGLIPQALGWWAISRSLPKLNAQRSALALLLQPVLATVWGWLFFTERLTALQAVGAAVTLGAIYLGTVGRQARVIAPEAD